MINSYVGIDGEGQGRIPHRYIMLCAAGESGGSYSVENSKGLTTTECLDFILSLHPVSKTLFSYAFLYDITKILEELPDKDIYELLRPELRLCKNGKQFRPIIWNDYHINWIAAKFTVRKGDRKVVVWDVFKFFQARFVIALDKWKIGTESEREAIRKMKDKREGFENESTDDIRSYCVSECRHLATLARTLTEAHYAAGLPLKEYYGAGSTASIILKTLEIDKKKRDVPPELKGAVMRAFFGGRFENSRIGEIRGPLYNWDISSAYPYQLFRLPCLEHGTWETTNSENEAKSARIACVWWRLENTEAVQAWGPFPFRTSKGSIIFPVSGGQGFAWGEEFFQGQKMFPNVRFIMAYIFKSNCECKPFREIPRIYRERCKLGKDGAGIVLKLGPNAVYGKIAQNVGNPKFNCWVWAGLITSNTRAQILEALANHDDYFNLVIVATDGIYTLSNIRLPGPEDTGTFDLPKPLGGWEKTVKESGMFAARPGVNFPLNLAEATEDDVKGRGFGRKALLKYANLIRESWREYGMSKRVQLPNISRFYGAKTSIWKVGNEYRRAPEFGTWYEYEPYLSFDPMPKRRDIRGDGFLTPHRIPPGVMSTPYRGKYPLDDALRFLESIQEEQPQ